MGYRGRTFPFPPITIRTARRTWRFTGLTIRRAAPFTCFKSNGFVFEGTGWGRSDDKPVVGDYDGDTLPDVAVFRESDGFWYVVKSSGGYDFIQFGQVGDIAVAGRF